MLGGGRARAAANPAPREELPSEARQRTERLHARAPMERHLEIAYGDMRIADQGLIDLTDRCLADAGSTMSPLKALHRPLASYFLARYFVHAMELGGELAE